MLAVQRFVDKSYLHSTYEIDDFYVLPDHKMNMLIETNIIILICLSSVSGLSIVFPAGSDALLFPHAGRSKDVYIMYSF